MLNQRFVLENVDLVQQNCNDRGVIADVARFASLETSRRALQAEVEELSRQSNLVSKSIGKAKDEAEREELYEAVYESDVWKNDIAPKIPSMMDRSKIVVRRIEASSRSVIQ